MVSPSAMESPCHWDSVAAPTRRAHAAHIALQHPSFNAHSRARGALQMLSVSHDLSSDRYAKRSFTVAVPEESRRSISCLSKGTPLASRAIQTLYNGTGADHHQSGHLRTQQLPLLLQRMHGQSYLCEWALPAGRHRHKRISQQLVSLCVDLSTS